MPGYLALILHGHLPFVRHPEHERFLEENWLFEAITECYIPLLQVMEGWVRDGLDFRLTMTLSPTLCAMLSDPLLQDRYSAYLEGLIELAEKETYRTFWEKRLAPVAEMYLERFQAARAFYLARDRDLVRSFRSFQEKGQLEIITTAATHALLPMLQNHLPSMRAQILVARDYYAACFGREPKGIWLPECAYVEAVEEFLQEAKIHWFVLESHGVLHGEPRPRYGTFGPVITSRGLAAFGRDLASAKQVWSREEGYPGDAVYRDFYRDIGFDVDLEYLRAYLPAAPDRSFTGIKYYRISGPGEAKLPYDPAAAVQKADEHASDFLQARLAQFQQLQTIMDRPAVVVAPYDAELFGHWWYEGPRFLDLFVRKTMAGQNVFALTTPNEFLVQHPTHQTVNPSPSSWGEEGYWKVWLNESNEWIYRHLAIAQERMTELTRAFPAAEGLQLRALRQAGRELLLAQSSDWPFILRTGTSPEYATRRLRDHLVRFIALHEQLASTKIDEAWLEQIEQFDNVFPHLDYRYWG